MADGELVHAPPALATPRMGVVQLSLELRLYNARKEERAYSFSHERHRSLMEPEGAAERFADAIAVEIGSRTPFRMLEYLPSKFRFFLEVRRSSAIEWGATLASRFAQLAVPVVRRFFAPDAISQVVALHAPGAGSETKLRLVFPDLVVDAESARMIHCAVLAVLYQRGTGQLRQVLAGSSFQNEEPVMSSAWHESLPSDVYALDTALHGLGSHTFVACRNATASSSHAMCAHCQGKKLVPNSQHALRLLAVLDGVGQVTLESDALRSKWESDLKSAVLACNLRAPGVPVTEGFRAPPGAPALPRKRKADGRMVYGTFAAEESRQKRQRTKVDDLKVLASLSAAVRSHHQAYENVSILSAYVSYVYNPKTRFHYPEYDVFVWGIGDSYCLNIGDFHDVNGPDAPSACGRVSFKITRQGVRQICPCRAVPPAGRPPCTDFWQKPRTLDDTLRRDLGYGMDIHPGLGDFYNQLTYDYLPALKAKLQGATGGRGGGGRGGRGRGRGAVA